MTGTGSGTRSGRWKVKVVKTQQLLKVHLMHYGPYIRVKAKEAKVERKGHVSDAGARNIKSRAVQWWQKVKERVVVKVSKEKDMDNTEGKDKHTKEVAKDMGNTEGKDKHGKQKAVATIQVEAMARGVYAGNAVDRTLRTSAQAMEDRSECWPHSKRPPRQSAHSMEDSPVLALRTVAVTLK